MSFESLIEKAVAKNWRADKTKTAQCTARSNRTGQSYRLACFFISELRESAEHLPRD
jgi:hypothetical protein